MADPKRSWLPLDFDVVMGVGVLLFLAYVFFTLWINFDTRCARLERQMGVDPYHNDALIMFHGGGK